MNSTSKKEHIFEELDKDNDKMITSNEFDEDLKWEQYIDYCL